MKECLGGDKMRIFMMYRLMSGVQSVASDKIWRPSGVPTAVKLIEALDQSDHELDLVFYSADPGEFLKNSGLIGVEGLSAKITILNYGPLISRLPYRLRVLLAPIWRAVWSVWHVLRTTPDIFYTDRGNVIAGGVVAWTTRVKTVLRVLGVPPSMWMIFDGYRPTHVLMRFFFGAPFSLVIGTKDGSSIGAFLVKALGPKVPWLLRINGVSKEEILGGGTTDILKLVFLGRLEPLKGAQDVLDAILELPKTTQSRLQLTFIGQGSLEDEMRLSVASADLQKQIKFTGAIEHKDVLQHLAKNDMYISLNEQGQISNANIEAAMAGLGLILSRTIMGNDNDAKAIWGEDMVIWIDQSNLKKNLQNSIAHLLENPQEVDSIKEAARQRSRSFDSWEKRINWEVDLLEKLSKKE